MSKKLIVMFIFVLMLPYLQPFYNIVNADNSEMQCENMSFSVFSIKESSDKIYGSGYPNDQLKIEFINHSITQNINIDSSGKFNIKIDETLLNKNDAIKISNEYFQIETNVVSENTNDKEVTAKQYKDCPVVEEVEEEPTSTEKESVEETEAPEETTPEADESLDETEVQEDDTPSEADEPIEVAEDREELPSSEEETQEEETTREADESLDETEVQEDDTPSEADEPIEVAEDQEELSSSEEEAQEEETTPEAEESVEEAEVQEEETTPESDEAVEVDEVPEERTSSEDEKSVVETKLPEESPVSEEELESDKEAFNSLVKRNVFISDQTNMMQPMATTNNTFLNWTNLNAEYTKPNESSSGKHEITLIQTGELYVFLDIKLSDESYAQFYIPPEIISLLSNEDLNVSYRISRPLLSDYTGDLNGNDESINMDLVQNRISVEFQQRLTIPFVYTRNYRFTITMKFDELPPTPTGEYRFYTALTTNNNVVDISQYPIEGIASATLEAPKTPEAPVFDSPVYSSHNYVRGSGPANSTIEIKIGNNTYTGSVNSSGRFSVTIPKQKAGTSIVGIIKDENGYESQKASVKVIDHLDSPKVEDVYSNDTEITGSANPNSSIIVTINDVEYTGKTNSSGAFSVTIPKQAPGTKLSFIARDDNGIESEPVEKKVIEAKVAFHQVPEVLSFNTTEISNTPGLTRIGRENPNWAMSVIDTRGKGSEFKVLVEADTPLTNKSGTSQLPNSLVFVDEKNNSQSIYGTPVEVFSGFTGDDQISQLSWDEDRGLMVEVDTLQVQPEEYGTTLTWTLSNGP